MPVRSLRSSVLKWPDRRTVHEAVLAWSAKLASARSDIQRIGYFGSYARGDWGIGSDLDLVVVLDASEAPFGARSLGDEILELPVGVDLLVYTADEWRALEERESKFYKTIMEEAVWVYIRPG